MELQGTSCDFVCPVFAHAHEAVSREKGFIAVEARTTVELDQASFRLYSTWMLLHLCFESILNLMYSLVD
jgi:hypothetical protein